MPDVQTPALLTAELLNSYQVQLKTCELLIQALQEKVLSVQARVEDHHSVLYEGNGHPAIQTALRLMEVSLRHIESTLATVPVLHTAVQALEGTSKTLEASVTSLRASHDGTTDWHTRVHLAMDAPKLEQVKATGAARVALISAGASFLTAVLAGVIAWLVTGKGLPK